jgi:hypothetical protein
MECGALAPLLGLHNSVDILSLERSPLGRIIPNPRAFRGLRDLLFAPAPAAQYASLPLLLCKHGPHRRCAGHAFLPLHNPYHPEPACTCLQQAGWEVWSGRETLLCSRNLQLRTTTQNLQLPLRSPLIPAILFLRLLLLFRLLFLKGRRIQLAAFFCFPPAYRGVLENQRKTPGFPQGLRKKSASDSFYIQRKHISERTRNSEVV